MLPSSSTQNDKNAELLATSPTHVQSAFQGRKEFAKQGNVNFRILAFAGGLSVILTSALSIVICIATLKPLHTLIYVYTLLFGVLICILEGQFIKSQRLNDTRQAAIEGLPVLKYLWGRGLLYVLSGSLQLSHLSPENIISGMFLIGVGGLFVMIGIHTRRRLKLLKKSLKDIKVLKRHFTRFDRDGDGVLDMDEFGALVAGLTGEDMDEDELEGAFGVMDTSGKGYVTLEEFQAWFQGFNAETATEESGGTNNVFQML